MFFSQAWDKRRGVKKWQKCFGHSVDTTELCSAGPSWFLCTKVFNVQESNQKYHFNLELMMLKMLEDVF